MNQRSAARGPTRGEDAGSRRTYGSGPGSTWGSGPGSGSGSAPGWVLFAALVGGVCGTGLRMLIDLAVPHTNSEFPLGTLLLNVVGAFVLGILVARLWSGASEWLKAGLGAGLLGSFTTFSALMVSLVAQTTSGLWMMAAAYLVLSLVLGLAAAALGLRAGRVSTPIDWVDE